MLPQAGWIDDLDQEQRQRKERSFGRDPSGAIIVGIAVCVDVSDWHTAQEALQQSERRFRQFGAASADALWICDAASLSYYGISPAYETNFGMSRTEALRGTHLRRWIVLVHRDDRKRVIAGLRRLRADEAVTVTHPSYVRHRVSDGALRWIRSTDFPLRGALGLVRRVAGISHDATDEVLAQERLGVLVHELHHRTRNLIAVALP